MKRILSNGFIYGILFFVLSFLMGSFVADLPLTKTLTISTLIALLAILANGLFYSRFTKSLKTLRAITMIFPDMEILKLETPASLTINDQLVSGKLFLTDKRLLFKSYKQEEYSWILPELHSFEFYPSIFNPGGDFMVKDNRDSKLIFGVDGMKSWKKALSER